MRPAFTLIEILVAIVVFTVGILALAATSGAIASQLGDGNRLTASAHVARSLLDSLGATTCATLMDGSATRDGLRAEWSVSRDSLAADVRLTVALDLRRATRRDTYRLLAPCAR